MRFPFANQYQHSYIDFYPSCNVELPGFYDDGYDGMLSEAYILLQLHDPRK